MSRRRGSAKEKQSVVGRRQQNSDETNRVLSRLPALGALAVSPSSHYRVRLWGTSDRSGNCSQSPELFLPSGTVRCHCISIFLSSPGSHRSCLGTSSWSIPGVFVILCRLSLLGSVLWFISAVACEFPLRLQLS